MAKNTIKIQCLMQWLRDRKVETGLTKKAKPESDHDERPHTLKKLKVAALIVMSMVLMASCGNEYDLTEEKKAQLIDSVNNVAAVQKRQADSVQDRFMFCIEAVKAGVTEKRAGEIYDSICKENFNFQYNFPASPQMK